MPAISGYARYRRILRFELGVIAQMWWYELVLPRVGFGRQAAAGRTARLTRTARRFHRLAIDLGGLMIKVGQFLSARLDVLPPAITDELAGLQDEVPAASFERIRALAEEDLGMPLDRAYAWFEPFPVAAASLGQAHRARLTAEHAAETGFTDVIVKVQRPGIDEIVEIDLAALRRAARWLSHIRVVSSHVDAPALVEEFAHTSLLEIDYLHEAQSAETFAAAFAEDPRVGAPDVAWERTTRRVLTLSDVTAIKINDVDGLRAAGIDPAAVAATFAEVMFEQLFTHGCFHADPHPGNIFVTPLSKPATEKDAAWRLTFVDFGMMGEIPDTLRSGLRRLLIAVAARDGKGLVAGIQDVGMLLPSADTLSLERALTQLFDRFGGMGFAQLRDIDPKEFREFGDEFGHVVRSLPFQLPENFLLVIRAMSLTSGVCSALDPQFNIWSAIEPFAARLLSEEGGNVVQDVLKEVWTTLGVTARLPQRIDSVITRIEEGRIEVSTPALDRKLARLERTGRRVMSAVIFAGLLVGGILMLPENVPTGIVFMSVSVVPLLHALFAGALGRR
ncbi:MAG TPA: AarF/UbiB family protein [Microbacterium sp.]|uniref:ABC1 kinase family protein n=1 Tax=Microbacterium sp. TaxID=51671 RepID=UPI002B489268|nr:AarF/UbiB family protein [Microbacterium sp.]HKT56977.1 AarF/UbiB family protein [Microbacterium sp.]